MSAPNLKTLINNLKINITMKNTEMTKITYEKPEMTSVVVDFADPVLQAVSDNTVIGPDPVIPD